LISAKILWPGVWKTNYPQPNIFGDHAQIVTGFLENQSPFDTPSQIYLATNHRWISPAKYIWRPITFGYPQPNIFGDQSPLDTYIWPHFFIRDLCYKNRLPVTSNELKAV